MENTPAQNICPSQNICPLCKQPNQCALAQTANTASQCWCMHVKIAPEILAQLPPAQKNLACICATCAQPAKNLP